MIITIGKPCAITEKGGRSNNEDSIYPLPEQVTLDQKLFMVCDGVGGAEKGEVASSLACESIQTFFSTFLKDDPTPEFIHKAVHYAEVCFDSYVQEHPEAMGMATTLTMAYIASSGIVLAHIGDSRIYHLRKGEILYQTEDHSLLNELSRIRELSFDEKKRYKHIITRSIMGNADDKVDHDNLELCFGDEILICTDGMYNEYPIDYLIESIRMDKLDIEKKNDSFMDNHSFIYILL